MSHFVNVSLLKYNSNYRLLWIGQSVSNFGTMITRVALPYEIYHLTHSTLMIGLLSISQLLPLLVTALYGGVLADRHHRKKLLLIAELLLALGCVLLILNSALASPRLLPIFMIAIFMSAITGLHRPALDSLTQQIVSKKDYGAASALSGLSKSVGAIAGPALAGLMIVHFGIIITFTVDLLTFLISLIALWRMQDITMPFVETIESTWESLKQGVKYAFNSQEIKGTYFVDFVAMIFGMPIALFPAISESFGGSKALGLLYAAPAAGALLCALFSGYSKHIKRHGAAIAAAASIWGLAIICFGLSKNLALALFFLVVAGAADEASGICRDIVWKETIPPELFGRLAGVNMISYLSGPRLGDAEAGLVAAAFGVTASVVSGGVLCIAGVALSCYLLPRFWHYRSKN